MSTFGTHPVLSWNFEASGKDTPYKVIVNQGGAAAGKTVSILQCLFLRAIESTVVVTCTAKNVPNIKRGILQDFITYVFSNPQAKPYFVDYNKTDRVFTLKNGSKIEFPVFTNIEMAKGSKRHYLFINEATSFTFGVFHELNIRTIKNKDGFGGVVFLDYNPSSRFWVHTKLIPQDTTKLFISNISHNPYLTREDKLEIIRANEHDENLLNVYVYGLTGRIKELVYNNYEIVSKMPAEMRYIGYGLDFGFSNSYTALVRCGLADNKIYIEQIVYERGLITPDLVAKMKALGVPAHAKVFADSANPSTIREIQLSGYKNIRAVKKGAGSIQFGIELIKSFSGICAPASSSDVVTELERYKYKRDKRTGDVINEVVPEHDHAMDAFRYWALSMLPKDNRRKKRRPRTSSF